MPDSCATCTISGETNEGSAWYARDMTQAALDDYHWLVSAAGEIAITRAAELLAGNANLVQCVQSLRKEFSAERAHLALETVELRQRARGKFSRAEQMHFTRTGLEQATDESIAAYKSGRFPEGSPIADWCTGIGGDLMALALRGEWSGADRAPALRLIAAHNLAVATGIGSEQAFSRMQEEIDVERLPADGVWHLDPDRRTDGKRSVRMEAFSPPLEFIEALLGSHPHGALKIAPASEIPEEWCASVEREWISRGGECRQQVVWFGRMARFCGEHAATIVGSTSSETFTFHGEPRAELPVAASLQRFLHEPDSAILAANLTGALAQANDLAAIAPGSVYLTSDTPAKHSALASFEIRDTLPLDLKQLRAYFKTRGIGRLEIKKRGVDLQPEELRKSLALMGSAAATLIVTRLGKKTIALVADRC